MKKYYILFIFAVVTIIVIQLLYVNSLYNNYITSEQAHVEESLYQAVDLELQYREREDREGYKLRYRFTPIDLMSDQTRDSLLATHPLPSSQPSLTVEEYDVIELIDKGTIKLSSQVEDFRKQDDKFENGIPLNIELLDSIFQLRLDRGYATRIEVSDSLGVVQSSLGDEQKYNYILERIPLGFKGYQHLTVMVYITLSSFIKQTIWVLALSLLIICIPLTSLISLLTSIRENRRELEIREQSINGIIHDLKSPLSGISTMLSLFRITENDPKRKEIIKVNSVGVTHLIKKVELLLEVGRYNRSKVVVCPEFVIPTELIERANQIKDTLQLSYSHKISSITVDSRIDDRREFYIDMMHFDTILTTLIDNSLKYSDDGVEISVSLSSPDENELAISVIDNGFGIDKREIKHVFKQFYRGQNKGIKGYGIGLSYLRAIAIAHGGAVGVESTQGEGSHFEVKLKSIRDEK